MPQTQTQIPQIKRGAKTSMERIFQREWSCYSEGGEWQQYQEGAEN